MARSSVRDRSLNVPTEGSALPSSAAAGPASISPGLRQESTEKARNLKRLSVLDIPHRQGQHNPSHQDSSQLQDILNPVRGVREALLRQGVKPVDYAHRNRVALRNISRQRQQAAEQPPVAPRQLQKSRSQVRPGDRDFVQENICGANAGRRKSLQTPSQGELPGSHEAGQVPKYLQARKVELAEMHAAKQAAKEPSLIPAGMRILPEADRLEMLETLQKSSSDVERQLATLPFHIETPSQIRHKAGLDRRMEEIEEAIRLFSQKKVLVQA
ncbi:hypothetical protein WJX74_003268 [Apatococcus lobatus]|uniref:Enkurin domain-containing protein n=1 Tax=Apatococcus lobatus TaxID=904363 RepID=A0AAW1SDE7_9CHLO